MVAHLQAVPVSPNSFREQAGCVELWRVYFTCVISIYYSNPQKHIGSSPKGGPAFGWQPYLPTTHRMPSSLSSKQQLAHLSRTLPGHHRNKAQKPGRELSRPKTHTHTHCCQRTERRMFRPWGKNSNFMFEMQLALNSSDLKQSITTYLHPWCP